MNFLLRLKEGVIFSDKKLANDMKIVKKSSMKYNNFCEGLYKNMMKLYQNKKCLKNEIGFHVDEIKERYNKYLIENLAKKASDIEEEDEDVKEFNDELKSSTISTYLTRLYERGNLTRERTKAGWSYRKTKPINIITHQGENTI